jgi:hypothetical protein
MLAQLRPLLDDFDAAAESINAFRDKATGHLQLTARPRSGYGIDLDQCRGDPIIRSCNASAW